ncbi:MAG: nuclear transport factor 2 family protein [Leptolyngbya sp. SIOISBB]|nr:nuclear transport factor 2 family protein [Leptolyngbya sp. SIOISBB]
MTTITPEPLQVAQAAFQDYAAGLSTGEWQAFLDHLSDDFTFWFPAGPFKGMNQGKDKVAAFLSAVPKVFPGGLTLTVLQITSNETTVVFEVRSQGRMGTEPYENQAAIAFEVRGDKITSYREYLGVVFQLGQ